MDSPCDFSDPGDALAEREDAVRIILERRYVIAVHGDFTCYEDRQKCLVDVKFWIRMYDLPMCK